MKVSQTLVAALALAGCVIIVIRSTKAPNSSNEPSGERRASTDRATAAVEQPATRVSSGKIETPRITPQWEADLFAAVQDRLSHSKSDDQALLTSRIDAVPIREVPRVLAALVTHRPAPSLAIRLLIERWSTESPLLAASWVDEHLAIDRSNCLSSVARIWAATAPDEALMWSERISSAEDRTAVINGAALEIARQQPELAFTLTAELPPALAIDVVEKAGAMWAQTSPQGALKAATNLAVPELRDAAIQSIALSWAESDPVSAGRTAVQSLLSEAAQSSTVVGIVQRWVQSDPAAAADWVTMFPAGDLGNVASENLVKLWADRDPESAGAWIESLAPGTRRDAATAAFAEKIAPFSPENAALWIQTIQSSSLRTQYAQHLAELWSVSNPDAASQWLTESQGSTSDLHPDATRRPSPSDGR